MAKVWKYLSQENCTQRQDVEANIATPTRATTAPNYQSYTQNDYCNSKLINEQQQHDDATATNNFPQQHVTNALLLQQQPQLQLTPAAPAHILRFPAAHVNGAATSTASAVASYMSSTAAYAAPEVATLELKRKSQINKLLHVGSNLDSRSFFYLTLLVLIYCCVLIRASAAAASDSVALANSQQTEVLARFDNLPEAIVATRTHITAADGHNASPSSSSYVSNSTYMSYNDTVLDAAADVAAGSGLDPETNTDTKLLHRLFKRDAANVPDDEDDSGYHDDEFDEYDALIHNKSAKGKYIGAPCNEMTCEPTLLHVTCDKETKTCGCEKNYPVQLGLIKGCDKPKKLGEQCFYDETCIYSDENSLCVQVRHNALCQCASGFHSVSYTKPTRRVFCTQDLKELSSDLPTLLGVTTGIAVLAGLICMVLHLFSKTKYPRHRNFGDANLPPPIMYSSDTGILPLTVQSGRPSSRSSIRSSGSIGSFGNRRASSGGAQIGTTGGYGGGGGGGGGSGSGASSKGILVSTSRTGSRRPSLASVHSTSSSVRSYSMMRFEKETQQKEIRHEMKLRLARLQQQQHLNQNKPQIIIGDALVHHGALSRITMPTPSPLTPNSLDELLPALDEMQEYPPMPISSNVAESVAAATLTAIQNVASTSAAAAATTTATTSSQIAAAAAYIGPCSSSTEAL